MDITDTRPLTDAQITKLQRAYDVVVDDAALRNCLLDLTMGETTCWGVAPFLRWGVTPVSIGKRKLYFEQFKRLFELELIQVYDAQNPEKIVSNPTPWSVDTVRHVSSTAKGLFISYRLHYDDYGSMSASGIRNWNLDPERSESLNTLYITVDKNDWVNIGYVGRMCWWTNTLPSEYANIYDHIHTANVERAKNDELHQKMRDEALSDRNGTDFDSFSEPGRVHSGKYPTNPCAKVTMTPSLPNPSSTYRPSDSGTVGGLMVRIIIGMVAFLIVVTQAVP